MKPIKYCLNPQLADICRRSLELEELTLKIDQILPPELSAQCKVSSFNRGCLVLLVNDPVWASSVRYLLPELRDKLRGLGLYQLTSIKINIAQAEQEYKKNKQAKPYEIPSQIKETIVHESQTCTYEPLRQALLHLANSKE